VPLERDAYRQRSVIQLSVGQLRECRGSGVRFERPAVSFLAVVGSLFVQRVLRIPLSDRGQETRPGMPLGTKNYER
jgi:hypothetical protein